MSGTLGAQCEEDGNAGRNLCSDKLNSSSLDTRMCVLRVVGMRASSLCVSAHYPPCSRAVLYSGGNKEAFKGHCPRVLKMICLKQCEMDYDSGSPKTAL